MTDQVRVCCGPDPWSKSDLSIYLMNMMLVTKLEVFGSCDGVVHGMFGQGRSDV